MLDLVITNAIVIDHWGIVKGDIGVRDGKIVKVGKAGNPDIMDGVDPELIIGASTEVIAAENMIVTTGAVDSHIHFICPQQIFEALSNGVTTMLGGEPVQPRVPMPQLVPPARGTRHACWKRLRNGP